MGIVLAWYALDALFVILFMTENIHTPVFQVLDSGVQITMTVCRYSFVMFLFLMCSFLINYLVQHGKGVKFISKKIGTRWLCLYMPSVCKQGGKFKSVPISSMPNELKVITKQWHAFSLFEVLDQYNQRQVFIQNVGNWTNELYHHLKR